jgi:23S rRNA pseudouridine1911/1915/1917 synthase
MTAAPSARAAGTTTCLDLPRARRGERLDRVLVDLLPDWSRAALQRLIRDGRVRLPSGPARASYRVRGGERLVIELPPPERSLLAAEDLPLSILHEDGDLVVLNKPPGLAVHPGAGRPGGTLVNALLHHCRDLSGIGGIERPGIVHRLDRATSGVLVIAKNDRAHRALAAQFKTRKILKVYEALVWGRPDRGQATIDAPIGRHRTARVRMAIRPGGRAARTAYRVVSSLGPVALLEVHPETGRTHQIRVHLRSIGTPIVGDPLYGGRRAAPALPDRFAAPLRDYEGLALHARRLGFTHPGDGTWKEFEAPRPPALDRLIERLEAAARRGPEGA